MFGGASKRDKLVFATLRYLHLNNGHILNTLIFRLLYFLKMSLIFANVPLAIAIFDYIKILGKHLYLLIHIFPLSNLVVFLTEEA